MRIQIKIKKYGGPLKNKLGCVSALLYRVIRVRVVRVRVVRVRVRVRVIWVIRVILMHPWGGGYV